jgi:hypothetical protein
VCQALSSKTKTETNKPLKAECGYHVFELKQELTTLTKNKEN